MTDITDQDRRDAREWAEKIDPTYRGNSRPLINAARVILATVDAPEPTLAESLHYRADLLDNGDPDGDTPQALRTLAARAAQMERDLTEARTEVERLTAERDRLEAAQHIADGSAWGGPVREPTVQKGAESNAETPAPADAKPGEAWIVEVDGERRTAVKDRDDYVPWLTVNADDWSNSESNENVTLLHRLVPAPRTIAGPGDLDALAVGTIIRDNGDDAFRKSGSGHWTVYGLDVAVGYGPCPALPATVLWEPDAYRRG